MVSHGLSKWARLEALHLLMLQSNTNNRLKASEQKPHRLDSNHCALLVFPECVAKGSPLTWQSEGRAVFADVVFEFATGRNCLRPSASVRIRLLWPRRWGELLKVTFGGCVACQFAPPFHCDLHKSGMSCISLHRHRVS